MKAILSMSAVYAACLLFVQDADAQRGPGFRGGRGPRGDANFVTDRDTFHFLLENHKQIKRQVTLLANGVETLTTSEDKQIVERLQEHVKAMYERVEKGNPIRRRDPLFDELFRHAEKLDMKLELVPDGVRVVETSDDPFVVKLIQAHAAVVSKFVEHGFAEAQKNHAIPPADSPSASSASKLTEEQQRKLLSFSAAFDRVYIPALALTNQQMQVPSEAAIARLRAWTDTKSSDVRELLGPVSSDSEPWTTIQNAIEQADALVQAGQLSEAHEALEPIRSLLTEERKRVSLTYPIDRLNEFHDVMESIVKPAMKANLESIDEQFLAQLSEKAVEASTLWSRVEQTSFTSPDFQLTDEEHQKLEQMIAAERKALTQIQHALRDGDYATILQAAIAIKPPFAKTYMLFGDFQDE
ncbi:MAG: hypothetical protein KDA52_22740 [Planctomycetaceae bacterium]|nr:hypothetical protein [Planctomycetaceae bacterium]